MQSYKDLKVWQVNQECISNFIVLVNKLPKTLAAHIIAEQLLRSLFSVGANLAEGYSSYEGKEYIRYAKISLRSATESDHWFSTLANIFIDFKVEITKIQGLNVEVIRMLKGLIKSIVTKRNS